MLRENKININKIAIILLVAVVVASIGEVLFNTCLLRSRADRNVTPYMEEREEGGYSLDVGSARYVEFIHVFGHVKNDSTVVAQGTYVNEFGKEYPFSYSQTFYENQSEVYIPIRLKVTSYEILISGQKEDSKISKVMEETKPAFNAYRFTLMFVTAMLFTTLVVVKDVKKHIVLFFVMASLGFGSVMIMSTGARISTWDEQMHFVNVYQMSSVDDVDWSEAAWRQWKQDWPLYNNTYAKKAAENEMNETDKEDWYQSDRGYSIVRFTTIAYIPMASVMKIGHSLNLPFVTTYELAKFANLFLFTITIALAIHLSKSRKLFIAVISLLPTVLFQGSMLTYDGFVYCMITLGMVLIANEIETPNEPLNRPNLIWAIFLIVMGSASKAIYIPLLLFLFLIPKSKFNCRKERVLFYGAMILAALAVMSTFVLPTLVNTISGNTDFGGDSRGGDTGAVKQVMSMAHNPIQAFRIYIENIFGFNNFRNMGSEAYDHFAFPNLMLLNLARYGVALDKWVMLLIPLLLLLFFYNDEENPFVYTKKQRITSGLIIFVVVGLIWTALYLSFTTVGSTVIHGVQARYYLPILLPTSYVLFGGRIKLKIKPEMVRKIALGVAVFFEMHLIYNLIILRITI